MLGLPLEPIFVNRRLQLRLFDDVLTSLQRGERRHIALLGLRRIGKTILLDEVRARHPDTCIVKLSVDTIVSTTEGFALDFVAAVLDKACRVRGLRRHRWPVGAWSDRAGLVAPIGQGRAKVQFQTNLSRLASVTPRVGLSSSLLA